MNIPIIVTEQQLDCGMEVLMILSLPELAPISEQNLGTGEWTAVINSVLMCDLQGIRYLCCGLRNGQLISFQLNMKTGEITDGIRRSLGSKPVTLYTLFTKKNKCVIAASNMSNVVYCTYNKLDIKGINLEVSHIYLPFWLFFFSIQASNCKGRRDYYWHNS